MDLYKTLILIILLNLTITLGSACTKGNCWENFKESEWANKLIENSLGIQETYTDENKISSQQSETTIEDTGGISKVILNGIFFFVIVGKILFGGLLAIAFIAYGGGTNNYILEIIGWGITVFIAILYATLGLKIYAWFANRDSR